MAASAHHGSGTILRDLLSVESAAHLHISYVTCVPLLSATNLQ